MLAVTALAAVATLIVVRSGRDEQVTDGGDDTSDSIDSNDAAGGDSTPTETSSGTDTDVTSTAAPSSTEAAPTTTAAATTTTVAPTTTIAPTPAQLLASFDWANTAQQFPCAPDGLQLTDRFATDAASGSYELRSWFPAGTADAPRMVLELTCYSPIFGELTSLSVYAWDAAVGGPQQVRSLLGPWIGGMVHRPQTDGSFIMTSRGDDAITNTLTVENAQSYGFIGDDLWPGVQGVRLLDVTLGRPDALTREQLFDLIEAWQSLVAPRLEESIKGIFWMDFASFPTQVNTDYRRSQFLLYPGLTNGELITRVRAFTSRTAWEVAVSPGEISPRVDRQFDDLAVSPWDGQSNIAWVGNNGSPTTWLWQIVSVDYQVEIGVLVSE